MTQPPEDTLRGSFTIPRDEQNRLEALRDKFAGIKPKINKSEIIRIGIFQVNKLNESEVKEILEKKIGRLEVGKPKEKRSALTEIIVNNGQWREITKLLPPKKKSNGRPEIDQRQVLNGILYIFRYEKQRRALPEQYGSYTTCWRRLKSWENMNIWKSICIILVKKATNELEKKEIEGVMLRTLLSET